MSPALLFVHGRRRSIFGAFLLHGLVFGKSQSDALRHFNVPLGAVFHTTHFPLGQRLAAKSGHARVETPHHHIIVHAVIQKGMEGDRSRNG